MFHLVHTQFLALLLSVATTDSHSARQQLAFAPAGVRPCQSYLGFSAAGQELWLNSEPNCHYPSARLPSTCPHSLLFSLAPSQLDQALVYPASDPHPRSKEWWADDVSGFVAQLQAEDAQATEPGCELSLLRVNQTVLLRIPARSLRSFATLLPPHIDVVVHLLDRLLAPPSTQPDPTLEHELAKIGYSPRVDRLISSLNPAYFLADIHVLTGTITARPRWITRHSFSDGAIRASRWIKTQFEQMGARCELHRYHAAFAPNVVCSFEASSKKSSETGRVVLGAHYDSRGSFGTVSAPGADDNALGCAVLLAIARSLRRNQVPTRRPIYFLAFSGTEQGLWGSQALAHKWRREGIKVTMMLNTNMIGYRVPGEPMQLGLPRERPYSSLPSYLIGNLTNIYVPELLIGPTPLGGGDEQSFGLAGFPSTSVFERTGPIANPFFRSSDDQINKPGYDLHQALTIGKALYATVLQLAGDLEKL